jgi:alcohol dehydrogenase class IV
MVTDFEFATATRIVFGAGRIADVPSIAEQFGHRILLVTGSSQTRSQELFDSLIRRQPTVSIFAVGREPTISMVADGAALARATQAEVVVSVGGGSVIDAGKAIAALATNRADISNYLEVIGRAQPLQEAPLPFIAVPTTAGTGSEVTRNAVLHSPEHRVKVSLRSPLMLPRVAIIDPRLTYGLPPQITASTGLDALTQLIEPFVSRRANPITDAICREGIPRAARSLQRVFQNGADADARADMALASLFGGLALANAGLGAVHGFAAPLGGMFSAPHGALCAALLPDVMQTNLEAAETIGDAQTIHRYAEVARLLGAGTSGRDAGDWVRTLCRSLKIPRLGEFGITAESFPEITQRAIQSSSMKANPIALTESQLVAVLQRAL